MKIQISEGTLRMMLVELALVRSQFISCARIHQVFGRHQILLKFIERQRDF